ncbi:MAG: ABC transporter permease subunit [Acidimicrobiaceae bacterium]|nr:ABC transporter permease subunit [Acidimicrobiaceae bacterium]MYK77938.1 ABC transporter permease subunit [Acidimicrobiaceae bacterium]
MDQAFDWIASELRWLLSAIKWPFSTLNELLVRDIMENVPWFWIAVAFFVIGSLARNIKVGVFAGIGIGACGFLGDGFWQATIETIGFVSVAVFLCVIIGVPVGVACGRFDAVWSGVRPVLDAMQVVHAFAYILPFIALFGLGNVGATIVTMFFALPPVVRLTNLGIRQVPADVVEASRAYGAPEWRVLVDVQLPLSRAAIMTGINQTLLLAMSMLVIAAIMGATGLGSELFQAISRQEVALGANSGLAFYLVAVVFDRISQPEGAEGGLLRRIRRAWAHRRDPEVLIPDSARATAVADEAPQVQGEIAPLTAAERRSMMVAGAGGIIAMVSVFLTWNSGAGFLSAYGRTLDEYRPGESFNGLSASGGSWFGFVLLGLGLVVVAAAVTTMVTPGRGPRWFTADGATVASLAMLVMMAAYLLAAPSDLSTGYSAGIGPWVALIGGLVASAGSVVWIRLAPHAPDRPLSARIGWGRVVAAWFVVAVFAVGAFSVWSFDERTRLIISPETQVQLDELTASAEANPEQAGVIQSEMSALLTQLEPDDRIITDGVNSDGPGLGIWVLIAGLAGVVAVLPAAGVFGRDEHRQWRWSAITAGIGAGAACVGVGWIFTHIRSAETTAEGTYLSGVGSFLAIAGGLTLASTAAGVLKEFRRAKIYADDAAEEVSAGSDGQGDRQQEREVVT